MLVNSKEVLEDAKKRNYSLVAPDFLDLDSARVFVNTAEKMHKPIILSFAQAHSYVISLEEAATVGKFMAENVKIPIVLHLDHGEDIDFIKRAMKLGFSSVMIDASAKTFAENVEITKEVVSLAHPRNITVEAEIGHVGQGVNFSHGEESESIYTTVEEAVEFQKSTQVDSLAVSIGTSHGIYKGNKTPILNFERLHELATHVPVPLVLHGGSGSGEENLKRCGMRHQ